MDFKKKNKYGYLKRTQNHYKKKYTIDSEENDTVVNNAVSESRIRVLREEESEEDVVGKQMGGDIVFSDARSKLASGDVTTIINGFLKNKVRLLQTGLTESLKSFILDNLIIPMSKGDINNKVKKSILTNAKDLKRTLLFKSDVKDIADVVGRMRGKEWDSLKSDEKQTIIAIVLINLFIRAFINKTIEEAEKSGKSHPLSSIALKNLASVDLYLKLLELNSFSSALNQLDFKFKKEVLSSYFKTFATELGLKVSKEE